MRDPKRFAPALLAAFCLAAPAPPAAAAPDEEAREFRAALESHWNNNLPALLGYLKQLDGTDFDSPDPPATVSSWSARPVYGQECDPLTGICVTIVVRTAAQVRNDWRRRVDSELERIATESPSTAALAGFEGEVEGGDRDNELTDEQEEAGSAELTDEQQEEAGDDIAGAEEDESADWDPDAESAEDYLERLLDE